MNKLERIACLYLTFLNLPKNKGLSYAQIKKVMPRAYQGDKETARRKFERDKEELKKLGLEIIHHQNHFASGEWESSRTNLYTPLEAPEQLPEIQLNREDVRSLALVILRAMVKYNSQANISQALQSLTAKLFYKDPTYLELLIENKVSIYSGLASTLLSPELSDEELLREGILATVYTALGQKKVLELNYLDQREEEQTRNISGRGLISHKGRWCLVAWCHKAKDYRRFYIDRILEAKLSPSLPYYQEKKFDIRRYSLHPLNLVMHEKQEVCLRPYPEYSEYLRDFLEAGTQAWGSYEESEADGSFRFKTTNIPALFQWILRHGASHAIEKIGPPKVRQDFITYLEQIKQNYDD